MLIFWQIDNETIGYGVLRFPGPAPSSVYVADGGWADLVPMRIIRNNPSASGKALVIGQKTHITGGVEIRPALDCLVLTRSKSSDSKPGSKPGSKSGLKPESKSGLKPESKSGSKSSKSKS